MKRPSPYKVQVVYHAGLPSGVAWSPVVLSVLSTAAQLELNEIVGYGNESSGDVGVQEWQNQEYREKRVKMVRSSFGTSPRANRAWRLLQGLKRHQWVSL